MKNKTELEQWLEETKAKNLSLEELKKHLENSLWVNYIWGLEGNNLKDKTEILFSKWQKEHEHQDYFEPEEWKPKRGDRVLVWDEREENAVERIFIQYINDVKYPVLVVDINSEDDYINGNLFQLSSSNFMKQLNPVEEEPTANESDIFRNFIRTNHLTATWEDYLKNNKIDLVIEKDFKTKVVELIENRIEERKTRIEQYKERESYDMLVKSNLLLDETLKILELIKELN